MKKLIKKWDGLDILFISIAAFFALAGAGIVIENILGCNEFKPIIYQV